MWSQLCVKFEGVSNVCEHNIITALFTLAHHATGRKALPVLDVRPCFNRLISADFGDIKAQNCALQGCMSSLEGNPYREAQQQLVMCRLHHQLLSLAADHMQRRLSQRRRQRAGRWPLLTTTQVEEEPEDADHSP